MEGGKMAVEDERWGAGKGGGKSQEASLYRVMDKEGWDTESFLSWKTIK